MIEQVLWLTREKAPTLPPLRGQIRAEVVVVGGGMAGMAAAQWLREQAGRDVVLLERDHCGAGATGRSSGFITPDSELQVADLVRRFGAGEARALWLGAQAAGEHIRANIQRFGIACDLVEADCVYLGAGLRGAHTIRVEHGTREGLGLDSRLYEGKAVRTLLGSDRYRAAVRYGGSFAIDGHAYVQGMKRALVSAGVRVFEQSPVITLASDRVETAQGSVLADRVLICLDRFAPELGVARDTWHAQTFLIASAPLATSERQALFPDGPLLAWDTDLIYQYFRLTADGRLLVGGGSLRETYAGARHESGTPRRLERFVRRTFPALRQLQFETYWPGLIGVTRDMLPLAGPSPGAGNQHQALCAAGLPWSVMAGQAAGRAAMGTPEALDRYLAPDRPFHLAAFGKRLPAPLTFPLSHLIYKLGPRQR
jgi:gamma-glutamylputrescine oxidase